MLFKHPQWIPIGSKLTRYMSSIDTHSLLDTWQTILSTNPQQAKSWQGGRGLLSLPELKQLLNEAVRIHTQRLAGDVLPDQITTVFMRVYREAITADAKPAFFRLLCTELGLQGCSSDPLTHCMMLIHNPFMLPICIAWWM
jgi:hypothetical protein